VDKKTLLYIIPLGLLVLFWGPLMVMLGLMDPPSQNTRQPVTQQESLDSISARSMTEPQSNELDYSASRSGDNAVSSTTTGDAGDSVAPSSVGDTDVVTVSVDTVFVETKLFTAALSTLGGGPISIKLKKFNYAYGDKEPIEMLSNPKKVEPQISFSDGAFNLSDLSFTVNQPSNRIDAQSSEQRITFSYTSPNGGVIEKRYTFYPDRYSYDLVTVVPDRRTFGFERNYQVLWGTGLLATEENQVDDYMKSFAMALFPGGPTTFGATGMIPFMGNGWEDGQFNVSETDDVQWMGIRSKYFTATMIPRSSVGERAIAYGYESNEKNSSGEKVVRKHIFAGFDMPIKATENQIKDSMTVYVGPLDWKRMNSYDADLQEIFDIGTTPVVGWMIRIFAVPIIWLLPRMYDIIPNYGFVIILLGVLVKLIVWPLSRKSVRSMAAMKELQPQLEALKEKHKSNPQALQKATMGLYKEAGVNPLASCMPMLLQMPLFLALFRVFDTTILFRGAPFILWWEDLSRGAHDWIDPYMILVLLMVGFQFAQQKVTMADQKNKAMMYLMPLVFGFMFRTFPSGLVIYWTTFNAFSFFEQLVGNRKKARENVAVKEVPVVTKAPVARKKKKAKKAR
jgi:YidC/Oxa1 family membrane protein insertase